MTREEAIRWLISVKEEVDESEGTMIYISKKQADALGMAIEALQREEAEEKGYCHRIMPSNVEVVVRCKDCLYKYVSGNGTTQFYVCDFMDAQYEDNGFCHHGKREGGEDE